MATLGFGPGYHDPVIVDTSLLNESLGEDDRPDTGGGNLPAPDYSSGPGPGGGPDIINQDTAAAAGTGDKRRVWQPGEDTGFYGTLGTNGDFVAPNGQPTGNRPIGAEEAAFNQTGSFINPFGGLQAAWNTANPSDLNPISHPSANNPNSVPSIEQQAFGGSGPFPEGAKPSLPDMAGIGAAPGGPQAMGAGDGWYIDSRGQFHSSNDGANINANRPNAGEGFSIGPGTIIDTGKGPKSPFDDFQTGADYARRGQALPGGLGVGGYPLLGDMGNLPAPNNTGAGGAGGGATGPFTNYNPRLGDTLTQTYGAGGNAPGGPQGGPQGGGQGLPAGFQRQGNSRLVVGPDGTQYVTDANGFLNPNQQQARDWQSRQNIDVNAVTQFAPDAIEKMRYLDAQGLSTPEEKRFLQTIGTGEDFAQTQPYADYVNRHNAQARSLGLDNQQLQAPARVVPMDQAFPILKEYGDLLRQLGASNVSIRPDNHTVYSVGSDTPIMQWRTSNNNNYALSGDTPLANVLDDVAKLRQIAAQQTQQQQAAAAATSANAGGSTRRSSAYGGGGGGGTSVQGTGAEVGRAPISAEARARLETLFPGRDPNTAPAGALASAYAPSVLGPGGVSPYDEYTGNPLAGGNPVAGGNPLAADVTTPRPNLPGASLWGGDYVAPSAPNGYLDPSVYTPSSAYQPTYQPPAGAGLGYGASGGIGTSGGPVNGYRIPTQYEMGPAPLDEPFDVSGVGRAAGATGNAIGNAAGAVGQGAGNAWDWLQNNADFDPNRRTNVRR